MTPLDRSSPFGAVVLAMLPAVLDQTMLATALPVIAGDLGPRHRRLVGRDRVRRRRRGGHAAVGQARRPPRPQAHARAGARRCSSPPRRCAASRRTSTQLIVLRLVQGTAAGGLMALAMAVGRRSRRAARARPLPGLHRGDVRRRDHRRAAARRRAGRGRELALGVPRQPAGRRSWRWSRLRLRLPAAPVEPPAHPLDGLGAALLAAATSTLMLACIEARRPPGTRAVADAGRCARAALVVQERRAADPIVPLRPAAHAHGRARERGAVPRDRRAVRGHGVRAAVPADDDGRDADRGRPAARPGDARHHRLDHAVRARDRAHRPLQALPGRRAGADDRRAGRAGRASPATRRAWHRRSRWSCSGSASGWSPRCS